MIIFQRIRNMFEERKNLKTSPVASGEDEAKTLKSLGNDLLAQGKLAEATDCYRRAVGLTPQDGSIYINLGYGQFQLGDLSAAQDNLQQAVKLAPDLVDAHFLLGQVLVTRSEPQQAIQSFKSALVLKPDFDFCWLELARVNESLNQASEALDNYTRALALNPELVDAAAGKGGILLRQGRWSDALELAEAQLRSGQSQVFLIQQAHALHGLDRNHEALAVMETVLAQNPDQVQALHGKATVLEALGQYVSALETYRRVIALRPAFGEALTNAGVVADKLGFIEEALAFHEQAVKAQPDHANSFYNLSCVLLRIGRFEEAAVAYETGLGFHPDHADLHFNKAVGHLLMGEFSQGWPEYEWRWYASLRGPLPPKPEYHVPMWSGEPIAGQTILLHAEQGLGDTIQLLRYVPLLLEKGANVLLNIPSAIAQLCTQIENRCILVDEHSPSLNFNYHCPMFSLPLAFKTEASTIPGKHPYLASDPQLRAAWEQKLGTGRGPRIGLVWSGNAAFLNDTNRSMALETLLKSIFGDYQLISLQKEVRPSDQKAVDANNVFHAGDDLRSFADTAALTDCMDLVISVDTSVAHLAGALGKPLWLMLPYYPDWRWMIDREDSPWYPTARLFRQQEDCSWHSVVERIARELPKAFPHHSASPG
ncbi:MAG: tetratricopeptide repeat protein [Polaromonas sp.]|nr:tetratricopeptide repeat protein [Polaromonas sp.]